MAATSPVILLLTLLLRVLGLDLVECTQPATADRDTPALCGLQDGAGRLWLWPGAEAQLVFDTSGLAGVVTCPAAGSGAANVVTGCDHAYWIDRSGRNRRTAYYENGADFFAQGLARYIDANGKYGFIDKHLNVVVAPAFDFAFPFEASGRARVCNGCRQEAVQEHQAVRGGAWGEVDKQGHAQLR